MVAQLQREDGPAVQCPPPPEPLYNVHLTFKRRDDVVRYLKRHEWEQVKESAMSDLWYHRGYCTAAVDMPTAMALTLACEVKSLQRENGELRETIRQLKAPAML